MDKHLKWSMSRLFTGKEGGGGSGYIIYPRKKNELLAVVGLFAMQPEG